MSNRQPKISDRCLCQRECTPAHSVEEGVAGLVAWEINGVEVGEALHAMQENDSYVTDSGNTGVLSSR